MSRVVGKRVLVVKETNHGHLRKGDKIIQRISKVYADGRVETQSGDCWRISPAEHPDYEFVAHS